MGPKRITAEACVAIGVIALRLAGALAVGPSTGPAGEPGPHAFRMSYQAGDRLLLIYKATSSESTLGGPAQPPRVDGSTSRTYESSLSIVKGKKPGDRAIQMTVARVREEWLTRQGRSTYDTAKPETMKGATGENLLFFKGLSFVATVDKDGAITDFRQVKKLAEKTGRRDLDASTKRALDDQLSNTFKEMLLEHRAYLPTKPVHIGDTWQVKRKLPHLELALSLDDAPAEKIECKLKKLSKTSTGQIAAIELCGTATVRTWPFLADGRVLFNVTKGVLVSQKIKMSVSLRGGMSLVEVGVETALLRQIQRPTKRGERNQIKRAKN